MLSKFGFILVLIAKLIYDCDAVSFYGILTRCFTKYRCPVWSIAYSELWSFSVSSLYACSSAIICTDKSYKYTIIYIPVKFYCNSTVA